MKPELRERIRDFNRRAEAAKRDGYVILGNWDHPAAVYDWDGHPAHERRRICLVEEYPVD